MLISHVIRPSLHSVRGPVVWWCQRPGNILSPSLCPSLARGPFSRFSLTLPRLECFITFFCLFFSCLFFFFSLRQGQTAPIPPRLRFLLFERVGFHHPLSSSDIWKKMKKKKEESATCVWHLSVGVRVWPWHVGEVMSWKKRNQSQTWAFFVYMISERRQKTAVKKGQRRVKTKIRHRKREKSLEVPKTLFYT